MTPVEIFVCGMIAGTLVNIVLILLYERARKREVEQPGSEG